jgi:hypothetical protein
MMGMEGMEMMISNMIDTPFICILCGRYAVELFCPDCRLEYIQQIGESNGT